jgi:DNA-binding beta-propeller fold protein YncE
LRRDDGALGGFALHSSQQQMSEREESMHHRISRRAAFALALCTASVISLSASAQIVVSANDNKAVLVDGVNTVPANAAPDTVSIIDLNVSPPKLVAEINVPASVVGPPSSVAVAPDESFAIVTAATKVDPADPKKTVPDNKVTIIDLKASPPAVVGTVEAGAGAAGLAINRAGNLVIVANRSEGSVSVFTVSGKTLTPSGKIQLGDAKSGPSAVSFSPDGKTALVTRDGDHKISILTVDGTKVEHSKRDLHAGLRPYPLDISSKGDIAATANIGMGGGDADTISLIDLKANPPRVVHTVTVGETPEGLTLSPDGSIAAVILQNSTNKPKASPFYQPFGLVKLFRIEGMKFVPLAEAKIGSWCQGAAWSKDGKTLLVQCMVEKEIQVLSFDGKELKMTGGIKVNGGPSGIRTAER